MVQLIESFLYVVSLQTLLHVHVHVGGIPTMQSFKSDTHAVLTLTIHVCILRLILNVCPLTGNWKEILLKHIDAEDLPLHWGGAAAGHAGDPYCTHQVRPFQQTLVFVSVVIVSCD